MIVLGSHVRDLITGFVGIAIGRTEWLYGCSRIAIEPQELKDGKPIESVWFDEQRVELVHEASPPMSSDARTGRPGGPQDDPAPRTIPSR